MKAAFAITTICAAALFLGTPASAHHSVAGEYLMDQRQMIEGELVQFLFRNPHSFVEVKAKDPATGEPVTWTIEWNGAGRLERTGVTANTLKPGDQVIITGQPGRKAEDHRLHMLAISRPSDGWKWARDPKY
jgi:Family of unknown function (DUF6152)